MNNIKKIAVLTGKRGGFGAMKPMLRLMQKHPHVSLQLIATDQHMNQKFGRTIDEIRQEFSVAAAIDLEQKGGTALDRSSALALRVSNGGSIIKLNPNILMLYGDRGEVLAQLLLPPICEYR